MKVKNKFYRAIFDKINPFVIVLSFLRFYIPLFVPVTFEITSFIGDARAELKVEATFKVRRDICKLRK
jgi:hypothetical protein